MASRRRRSRILRQLCVHHDESPLPSESKVRALLLVLLPVWILVGCGDNMSDLPLEERIDDAVARIEADTCFLQSDTSACEWANYEVGRTYFDMAASTGEAVLVVDGFGAGLVPQFVRYRDRILDFYQVNGDRIEAQTLSVRLPKQLGDVLISFAGPKFIPANLLTRINKAAGAPYGKLPLLYLGHGGVVFGNLVELAPEQPLVLLELSGLLDLPPSLCERLDNEALATATAHFAGVAASLKQVMNDHNVRFVNASFGDTTQTLATGWSRTCGSAVPSPEILREMLHMYEPVYDVLFNSEGVLAMQAATSLGDPLDFPFDQVSLRYGNRVRVGFISSLVSELDEMGRGPVQKVEQFPPDGDADVYLNWDCEAFVGCADLHYEVAGAFGFSTFAVEVMSTSYINPLSLGRLLNLRYANHGDEPMSNALIQTLKKELTPSLCGEDGAQPCVYQDPLAHRQFEVYRRHYR